MDIVEKFFISLGAAVVVYQGSKTFSSMGEWAVVTGASEGIGRAYAFAMAKRGMNVVIMSRTKTKLDEVATEIARATGKTVKVIATDFVNENVFSEIEDQLNGLNIGVLVNNVGMLPGTIPRKYLDTEDLDKVITQVINCNVKTMAKMCKIVLPGMEKRGKGLIVNISSGIASIPFPLYSLYAASKVFVERFSQGLQTEYKDKGIIIQAVAPFGVSTRMAAYQETNIVTLSPEDFVESSLQYIRAGDRTNGSICHAVLGWILLCIPLKLLYTDCVLNSLQNYVKSRMKKKSSQALRQDL